MNNLRAQEGRTADGAGNGAVVSRLGEHGRDTKIDNLELLFVRGKKEIIWFDVVIFDISKIKKLTTESKNPNLSRAQKKKKKVFD